MVGAALAAIAMGSCSVSGPSSIRTSRTNYNEAIALTSSEQLLLNLVRLRYRDVPLFLEVSSVTTTFGVEVEGSLRADPLPPELDSMSASGTLTLSERPSVTYVPLQGEDFVRKLMTPLATDTLALMYHSGWSLDRMLKVCVRRLGPLVNAASASGPTPRFVPEFKDFFEAANLLERLWEAGDCELGLSIEPDGKSSLVIRFTRTGMESAEVSRLKVLLGLPAHLELRGLSASQSEVTGDGVALVTRSLMACMYFLSQGVEPPPEDLAAGRVTQTLDASGESFDWTAITGGLMRIRSGRERPANAYTSVQHRGTWFWISDDDLDSKSTFALLGQLLELQSGGAERARPVLTIPVGF